jgi:hypothetical protein
MNNVANGQTRTTVWEISNNFKLKITKFNFKKELIYFKF